MSEWTETQLSNLRAEHYEMGFQHGRKRIAALQAELAREKAAREAAEGQSSRWFKSFTDETLARSADIVRLTAERDAAEKARDEFVWLMANGARCSFCGENMLTEESAQHMETCLKHPLQAEREITRGLRAKLEAAGISDAPCGGNRCFHSENMGWIHSTKSYGTCTALASKGGEE